MVNQRRPRGVSGATAHIHTYMAKRLDCTGIVCFPGVVDRSSLSYMCA